MKYIDCMDDYEILTSSVKNKDIIILPTFENHEIHYVRNKPSLLYIQILENNNEFVVGLGHPDLFEISVEKLTELSPREIWTIDQKRLLSIINYNNINDVSMFYYLVKNNVPEWILDTATHLYYQRKYSSIQDINNIIPATKHIEIHQMNAEKISYIIKNFSHSQAFLNYRSFLNSIYKLESTGLKVNSILLQKFYSDKIISHISSDNYVYSEYNFYTSAGRPSNRYGSINFAAIEKNTGVRKAFVPRYDNLLLFDFDSFHLHLIAKFIKYKFDTDNIHSYLGRYYFGKESLSDEEYEQSKILNFKYLYGGIPKDVKEVIPYFDKVQSFMFDMWSKIKKDGYYLSPLTKRKIMLNHIEDPTPTKVLNYFIQLMETETNMVIIDRLQKYLKKFKTKLILYTYDSFLFDYSKDDGKNCILGIKNILDVFPTKVYFGTNYQNLIDVTNTLSLKTK